MKNFLSYINPLPRLGDTKYSFFFPLCLSLLVAIASEVYAYGIVKDPLVVGVYIIFVYAALVIYFALRDGILGGVTTSSVAILYYFYIIYTRHFHGKQFDSGVDTTITLGGLYFLIGLVVGFLKQKVDSLLEQESNARARLEAILEQLPAAVVVTDSLGKVEYANKKTHELFDNAVVIGGFVGGHPERVRNYDNSGARKSDSPSVQVLKTGRASKVKEFIFTQKDGTKLYTRSWASPIKNKKGEVTAIASISTDITIEKEQEERKDDFIKMASHELKTPLTSAKVFTQVLEKKIKGKKDKELLPIAKRLDAQIDKLTLLVGDLLDVTRAEQGNLQIKKEQFFVRPLAEEVIEDLQLISNHKLVLRWTTKLPVIGDKERIRQVFTNFITNAIKYSPENGTIVIGSRKNKDKIEVFVQDFGNGIAKGEQKKIFNRFYQVAEHSTYPGLGLGLYISSEIIKQHKGKIWVESEKGKGSIFWFSLPIAK